VKTLRVSVPFPARGRVGAPTSEGSIRALGTSWATPNRGEFHVGVRVRARLPPPRGRLASANNPR
jgi:hypothetical protein